jgi:hypothetical protein
LLTSRIPSYRPVPEGKIVEAIENFGAALAYLATEDSAKLMTPDGEANFNMVLKVSPDSLLDLLIKESLTNESVMILKVKRPDYLGESMWDFKLGEHPLQAKILDRNVDVRPGDAIRAKVSHTINYGYGAEVVSERYEVMEVLEVTALVSFTQPPLLEE